MKTLFKILMLSMLITISNKSNAQQSQASRTEKFLERYVSTLDTAKTDKTWDNLENGFDRLASTESGSWLNNYYASFTHAIQSTRKKEKSLQEYELKQAMMFIVRADSIKQNESEIINLKAMITAMSISLHPEKAMELGPESTALYNQAKNLNPENPRVYLGLGESAMYTPEQYGGGKKKAIEILTTATDKYKSFVLPQKVWPHWGEDRTKMLLEKCKSL